MTAHTHHYALDAVPLLDECMQSLQRTIDQDLNGSHDELYGLKEALISCERYLHEHLTRVLEKEQKGLEFDDVLIEATRDVSSTMNAMTALKKVLEEKKRKTAEGNRQQIPFLNPQDPVASRHSSTYSVRSATDTLLFRLIVALQLCLMRIGDAHLVLTGHRRTLADRKTEKHQIMVLTGVCAMGTGLIALSNRQQTSKSRVMIIPKIAMAQKNWLVIQYLGALLFGKFAHSKLKVFWMRDKLSKSTIDIDEWIHQWQVVQLTDPTSSKNAMQQTEMKVPSSQHKLKAGAMDLKTQRLIEYALHRTPKASFWQSQGEIRFLMLKRFMDVYYASVSTAIDKKQTSVWQLPLVTGAAASFYSLTGASRKASQAVNSGSHDLIQHAWGMVSLPAIKNLMLQASRLIKGASVADRITIQGVSCFVLSRGPAPELAAAIKRQYKSQSALASRLSTITESEEHSHDEGFVAPQKKFAGTNGRYRQRDVIFHLTGGGFFSHIIGSDLPYLLDWSESTNAVVICPEYALLPEHIFPVALEQIAAVYCTLIHGDAVMDLGFEVNRIVVTGESTGGNLAASLCVKLGQAKLEAEIPTSPIEEKFVDSMDTFSVDTMDADNVDPQRLPDALMLSCAALNLSLELTHSRVIGSDDPVLPSGLISAISDAYLPEGLSKQNPLASPFFASDAVLRLFPPVLLFAGSNDPLLDDSVAFNERLRCLGVNSELRAAHNMPHAYWGLGTAGFPEALQVQKECQEFLTRQLR